MTIPLSAGFPSYRLGFPLPSCHSADVLFLHALCYFYPIYGKISQMQDIDTFNIVAKLMSINISKKKRDSIHDTQTPILEEDNLYLTMNDFVMN